MDININQLKYHGEKHDTTKPDTTFQYVEDDLLSAEDYNEVPNKVNEIITVLKNRVCDNITDLEKFTIELKGTVDAIQQSITGGEDLNVTVPVSEQSVTNIVGDDELRLDYDNNGKLCIVKYQPLKLSLTVNPNSVEIDTDATINIEISKISGTDDVDVSSITVTADHGTLTKNSDTKYSLNTNETTTITANVNDKQLIATVNFNKKQTASFRSTELLTIEGLTPQTSAHFNINLANVQNYKLNNYNATFFTNNAVENVMTYMYFITTKCYTTPEEIKQHIFRNNSAIGGGFIYVGNMKQYSTNEQYYVYRTTDKYDTTITVNIK